MTPHDDGGPAYPIAEGRPCWRGKSIRDSFAEAALIALVPIYEHGEGSTDRDWIARLSYTYADAMMAARAKTVGGAS